jgi:glycosyltransferase involved in cell wall biosynthesis
MGFHGTVRAGAPNARVIYDAHNAETFLQRTMFTTEGRDPRRWHAALYSLTQWSKLSSYERIMLNAADLVLAVSEEDATKLRGRRADPRVVPNGVDPAAIPFQEPAAAATRTLLFMGPLDYRPNADAVRWLVSAVLPAVRRRLPDARLRLVGRGSERIQAEGVDAVGYVPDAAAELRQADALVVPMRMGSGTRFKVLEAMASGVPVISTPLGLAGIAAEPGKHALVGSSTAELAEATVQVLEDRALARSVARAARTLVEQRYAWKRITPTYLSLLREVVHTRR